MRVISGKAKGIRLASLEGNLTRPTLDRVKEALFNIIQTEIVNTTVLDLFAGSGALGIEALSRGAKKVILCDKSPKAINTIKINLEKTKLDKNAEIILKDYEKALNILKGKEKFDLIFIDPPYADNMVKKSILNIMEFDLLNNNGKIIIETDDEERILKDLEQIQVNVYDLRKYGRVKIIFLNRKG